MFQTSSPGPAKIVLIRHAQKTGLPDDRDLSELGRRHAETLLSNVVKVIGRIDSVIAAKSSRKSRRPKLTVEPYATAHGLPVNETWDTNDYQQLAAALLDSGQYQGKNVLICWRHDTLEALAHELGALQAPPWRVDLYDRIWLIEWTRAKVKFRDVDGLSTETQM